MIEFEGDTKPFAYRVSVGTKPDPRIIHESLGFLHRFPRTPEQMIFATVGRRPGRASADIKVEFNNFSPGRRPQAHVSSNHSVLSQYVEFARKNKKYDQCVGVVNGITNYLRASFVFDPNPKLMRGYERMGNRVLARDGANLSAVLYGLHTGKRAEQASLKRLLKGEKIRLCGIDCPEKRQAF